MSRFIEIPKVCQANTLLLIADLETRIAAWTAALATTTLKTWERETYTLYISAAEKQLTAFRNIQH